MASPKFTIFAAIWLLVLAIGASAVPIELKSAITKPMVCPIRVETLGDPNRIPRRIKTIRCLRETNTSTTECRTVTDKVRVYNKELQTYENIFVDVGCVAVNVSLDRQQADPLNGN